ncbi:hypothetical protein Tco_0222833 [Tanacetum coccineum]
MDKGFSGRMLMEYRDAQGQSVFTSQAWRRLFEIQGPLFRGVRRRMSWREFILGMGLHTAEEIESIGFSVYWAESARQITDKMDLSAYWLGISSAGDFLSTTSSYTSIRDPMLRLCHRLIACNIAGRSQAPKKVIVTDLFYLRGMDVGSVNIPYLLARYLRMFASRRKRGAMISRGEFICEELDDTWAWVALGLERQQVAADGAPEVAEDAPIVDEVAQAVPAPVQVPQPPPAAGPARTMA